MIDADAAEVKSVLTYLTLSFLSFPSDCADS